MKKSIYGFAIVALTLTAMRAGHAQDQLNVLTDEFIFTNAPFKECHASTLVELEDGRMMAAWFGGEYERHANVAIWTSVLEEDGWSAPQQVANGRVNDSLSYPTWNPVLFQMPGGRLGLFYKEGPSPQEWWGNYISSSDSGLTWSAPKKLADGFYGPIKNKPILLEDGSILAPSSVEDEDGWRAHIEISEDGGDTWEFVPIDHEGDFDVIQPSILVHEDGRLQVLCRSKQDKVITAWSEDNGRSWSALEATEVMNPNSGTDAVTLADGRHLLVYNPAESGHSWSDGRTELRLAISTDGLAWKDIYTLVKESSGEYSYPAIIQSQDGHIHISYTWDRKRINYLELELEGQ